MEPLLFYHHDQPHGYMSNFSRHPIELDDKIWATSEHFFQAMKSLDPEIQEAIRLQPSPGKAAYMGRSTALRSDWDEVTGTPHLAAIFSDERGIVVELVKDHFMFSALVAKFTQHPAIAKELLETGDRYLIENTHSAMTDPYWGNGPSLNGLNKLGRMLMIVRKRLREAA